MHQKDDDNYFLLEMMTNERVYELAEASNVGPLLLKHVCAQKSHYFGYFMKQPCDNIEGNLMTSLVEEKRKAEHIFD